MDHFQAILDPFFPAAAGICNEVLGFQPHLVICLMHSGWLPLQAGMELWTCTQQAPFPPVVRANLGREKFERYESLEARAAGAGAGAPGLPERLETRPGKGKRPQARPQMEGGARLKPAAMKLQPEGCIL